MGELASPDHEESKANVIFRNAFHVHGGEVRLFLILS